MVLQAPDSYRKLPKAKESSRRPQKATESRIKLLSAAAIPVLIFAHLGAQRARREQGKTWRRRPRPRSRPPLSHLGVRRPWYCHPVRARRAPRIERRRRRPDHAPEESETFLENSIMRRTTNRQSECAINTVAQRLAKNPCGDVERCSTPLDVPI